ncbi:MAG: polyprenyl diphosphate synthase [Duodenibacillus sp.]
MSTLKHLAVIMDGNGRWAKRRFLPRIEGHRRGIESLRGLVGEARRLGIESLSVFAFSSENWRRPEDEVSALMRFFVVGLQKEAEPLAKAGVRLHIVGDKTGFTEELVQAVQKAETMTAEAEADGSHMHLNVCINYGGRWDIVQAAQKLARQGEAIDMAHLERELTMAWSGPVDLMIRTGGESRISNFILWQAAYAELYFTERLWPDFGAEDLAQAVEWFASRERRFGMTSEQISGERS